jgi:SagB-type dehydrogenase family enzyme
MSAASHTRLYRRSPFLLLQWEGSELVALHADTLQRFQISATLLNLLSRLSDWISAGELIASGVGIEDEDLLVLSRIGILQCSDDSPLRGSDHFVWDPFELVIQRRTAFGGYRAESADASAPPNLRKQTDAYPNIALPEPVLALTESLGDVLERRRTVREYASRALQFRELSTLLYHAARMVRILPHPKLGDRALRTYPTAGARSELEIYIVSCDITELSPGAYYYDPCEHRLARIRDADAHQARIIRSVHAATSDSLSRDPSAILLITAVFERVMWKYQDLGLSLIYKNVGALFQTLYLVATALGLAPCAIGGGEEAANSAWLGLDPLRESQVGCFLIGPTQKPGLSDILKSDAYVCEPSGTGVKA